MTCACCGSEIPDQFATEFCDACHDPIKLRALAVWARRNESNMPMVEESIDSSTHQRCGGTRCAGPPDAARTGSFEGAGANLQGNSRSHGGAVGKFMIDILSLGAGVQSSTILIMACLGDLPKFEHAIFADPGWEPKAVYRHLDVLEDFAGGYGIKIHRVSNRNIKTDALTAQVRGKKADGQRWAALPYFTRQTDGKIGMIRRQCTSEYKIKAIHRKARELERRQIERGKQV